MNNIEILEKELANINNLIEYYTFENLDYDKKYRMERFYNAIEQAITALKERQADKDRIKELQKQANELVDDYEEQLSEKNNYIFQLENEREALHKLIDEEMG